MLQSNGEGGKSPYFGDPAPGSYCVRQGKGWLRYDTRTGETTWEPDPPTEAELTYDEAFLASVGWRKGGVE